MRENITDSKNMDISDRLEKKPAGKHFKGPSLRDAAAGVQNPGPESHGMLQHDQ